MRLNAAQCSSFLFLKVCKLLTANRIASRAHAAFVRNERVVMLVPLLPVSSHYPGLVPAMPGALASLSLPGAARLGFHHMSAGVSVLLVSNLNPEVSPSLRPAVAVLSCFLPLHLLFPQTTKLKTSSNLFSCFFFVQCIVG